jgi:thymidylate kinase
LIALVLEGISGCGKTTQAALVLRALGEAATVESVGEFSSRATGRTLRRCYRGGRRRFVRLHDDDAFADQTHFLLLADTIAKSEQIHDSRADLVIVDRLFDSWLCYTLTAGEGVLSHAVARHLHARCRQRLLGVRTLAVFLDVQVGTALVRLDRRDRFGVGPGDGERLELARDFFRGLYADDLGVTVDGEQVPALVTAEILDHLKRAIDAAPRES